ncbi:hypothetical protein SPRG_09817 [Saprolegnia parasitica CBS 223.65]|uniref:Transmembrane protein 107 n=1 Tax=Saprolegnia parasitica (strain CBS 223.65) TaxID=695850 RepID=A0A067CC76_SAPPC|nr:hypothetical protein SPRG_09817 [Saprolegnia parasitica CBS 223.65]KDO24427.1 hypothetical protein SPRG_09817 [Saprolegnia parasitica CBS 223.65]|eukprot:XP_012204857.1 hypothetical protein SPRG_09817 [Saprolegnia parasitica CBS 223.65]
MNDVLVPARFVLTMGHLMLTGMAWRSRARNVLAALPPLANVTTSDMAALATASVEAAWVFALLGFAVSLGGLVRGASGCSPIANATQIVAQFVGSLMLSRFLRDELHYIYLWYIVAVVHVPSLALELGCASFGKRVYPR